jgi:hypothetical protein
MGHEVPHFCSSEVRRGKGLKVNKKAVPESPFYPTGRSHEKIAPNVSTASDAQGEQEDLSGVEKEPRRGGLSQGKVIDGVFNDPRYEELKEIDEQQGKKPHEDLPPVIKEILLEGFKRFHFLRKTLVA